MTKEIQLLFAGGLDLVESSVFGGEGLQLLEMFSIFLELRFGSRERIEQVELLFRREQRLVIVRAVKIDQGIADVFQDRQGGGRSVDELTIVARGGKCSLNDKIIRAPFDARFDQLRIQFLQFFAGKNRFRCASIGAGA